MEKNIEKLDSGKVKITFNVPFAEWEDFIKRSYTMFSRDIKVPGFRGGKVPQTIVDKEVGRDAVVASAVEETVRSTYDAFVKSGELRVIGTPDVHLEKSSDGETLIFAVTTDVMPEVKLSKWRDAAAKVNKIYTEKTIIIDDLRIDKEMKHLADSRAKLVTVSRAAALDDVVVLDFNVFLDGVPIENGTAKNHSLHLGKATFIPGFEEEIVGLKSGDEKTFTLTFPEKYHAAHLAGKKAEFRVNIKVVQKREVPLIDDAFAVSLGKFADLADLKKNMTAGLSKEEEKKQKEEHRNTLLDAVLQKMTVFIPDILIESELTQMQKELEMNLQSAQLTFAEYLKNIKKTKEEIYTQWRGQAEKRVKSWLLLEHLGKELDITVQASRIEEEMNKVIALYGGQTEFKNKISMPKLYAHTKDLLQNEEVFLYLEKIA